MGTGKDVLQCQLDRPKSPRRSRIVAKSKFQLRNKKNCSKPTYKLHLKNKLQMVGGQSGKVKESNENTPKNASCPKAR